MSEESNILLALKNAWTGAVAASERIRELDATVQGLDESTGLLELDLDTYHAATVAQSSAVLALRGLVEELKRKQVKEAEAS